MEPDIRSTLKNLSLAFRHLLEGEADAAGNRVPGDLESRLNQIGVWRDRVIPSDEIPLSEANRKARRVVDAYIEYRADAGVGLGEAVDEYIRESAYTWFNRLFALRCMEARGIIVDPVILQEEAYGGRSLKHRRLSERHPELCSGEDDGLYALLFQEFEELSRELPEVFNPDSPAVALRPSVAAIKKMIALLSGREPVKGDFTSDGSFVAADTFGWAYQYWNTEEKDRVFENVRVQKTKISGRDIIPVTCLYTEPYMVKFLVQNSLGAQWMCMHPDSKLYEKWEYYVRDADRSPLDLKLVREITFLDPACGSGHFLLEAFDLYYDMYLEEGEISKTGDICGSILENNLFGIDIDERAIQIAIISLWMKAKEKAPRLDPAGLSGFHDHLVATNIKLPKGKDHLEEFLKAHPEDAPLKFAIESIFNALENAHEIGSLLKVNEPLSEAFEGLKTDDTVQTRFMGPNTKEELQNWSSESLSRLKEHFNREAESVEISKVFFGQSAKKGLYLINLLSQKYDIVATNPPFMHCSNFGPNLKEYIYTNYPQSSQDLYSAFLEQSLNLSKESKQVALVSQQSFMFLERHKKLRLLLFERSSPEIFIHLGPHAFSEISGEIVNVILLILQHKKIAKKKGLFIDLTKKTNKADALKTYLIFNDIENEFTYFRSWFDFEKIPGIPFIYNLNESELNDFQGAKLGSIVDIPAGMVTGKNTRYVKYWWEVDSNYTPYMKGGQNTSWYGNFDFVIDITGNGFTRMRDSKTFRAAGYELYGKKGVTYSSVSTMIRARVMEEGSAWDCGGPAIIPKNKNDVNWILAFINSTYALRILYLLNPTINIKTNDLKRLPIFESEDRLILSNLANSAINISKNVSSLSVNSRIFKPREIKEKSLNKFVKDIIRYKVDNLSSLSIIQEMVDFIAFNGMKIDTSLIWKYKREIHSYPTIDGYNMFINNQSLSEFYELYQKLLDGHNKIKMTNKLIEKIAVSIIDILKNKNASYNNVIQNTMKLKNETVKSNPESFIEEISSIMKLHPISVYWILSSLINDNRLRLPSEEKQIIVNFMNQKILNLFGYQWPNKLKPRCNKYTDGIIVISNEIASKLLVDDLMGELCRDFQIEEDIINQEFKDIMGKPIDEWIINDFFKTHIQLFRKRPILWQLQSESVIRKANPAFSCLIYYHKINEDTLPKIRTQYLGPIIGAFKTEARTLDEYIELDPNQAERRIHLRNTIEELETFDKKLEQVITSGFDSNKLKKLSKQEILDNWASLNGVLSVPTNPHEFVIQEKKYIPDLLDGVRVNISPLQKFCLFASNVLSQKDLERAIDDRAEWRTNERDLSRKRKIEKPRFWIA